MATGEDGGATANATFSSYGGGGVGGKFRRKPPRKQTTPYDRPPTVIRGNNNNNNNSSWLKKLVVEPASKLISYGADRFFASVFRPRLPSLPPPQPQPQPQPPGYMCFFVCVALIGFCAYFDLAVCALTNSFRFLLVFTPFLFSEFFRT